MPYESVNGVSLYCEVTGEGDPVALIHGAWVDHASWSACAKKLSERHTVLTYDRRGHSASTNIDGADTVKWDADDLLALTQSLGMQPFCAVGNSSGGSVAMHATLTQPAAITSVSAHEPPLMNLLGATAETKAMRDAFFEVVQPVVASLAAGNIDDGARTFAEVVSGEMGAWDALTPDERRLMVTNGLTFLHEFNDQDAIGIDCALLAQTGVPLLLTRGEVSSPAFAMVVDELASRLPAATVVDIPNAGHEPHITHPDEYARLQSDFFAHVG